MSKWFEFQLFKCSWHHHEKQTKTFLKVRARGKKLTLIERTRVANAVVLQGGLRLMSPLGGHISQWSF